MSRNRDEDSLPLSKVPPVAEDVRRELEFHIEQRVAELIAGGMSREQAAAKAREAFGDRVAVEEECREIETRRRDTRRRMRAREALRQDVALGIRMLRRSPGFALAAIATLALGVGANTAVFSIVNTVLLRPLPFAEPERLVHVVERHEKGWADLAWTGFLDVQSQARSFSSVAAYTVGTATVLGARTPMQVHGAAISRDFFRVFPLRPTLGRLPLPDEHRMGAAPVVVVSHAFWRDHLGAPSSLEGVHIKVDADMPVVGVLPQGFDFPNEAQIWMPVERTETRTSHTAHNYDVVGRLRDGLTVDDARRDLDALFARVKPLYAPDFDAIGSTVTPLQEELTRTARTPLYLLLGASAFLLLAACTNLASSLLARGTARAGEMAVRSALGASQSRLVRQLLTESAILAVLGCLGGVVLAVIALRVLVLVAPSTLPVADVHLDARVLAFAGLTTVLTTFLFGALPAMRLSRANAQAVLRDGARGTQDRGKLRLWNILVAAEVAFAVALLAGSVLLIRSFAKVLDVELGFDPSNVETAEINLPAVNYDGSSPAIASFHARVLERLRASPGVASAGFVSVLPVDGDGPSGMLEVAGRPLDANGPHNGYALYRVVGGDYFEALGIRVLMGRTFRQSDDASAPPVVVVSEDFARHYWPNENPIGKQVRPYGMDREKEPFATVIGVVGNTRSRGVTGAYRETYYFDHRQRPPFRSYTTSYVVRAATSRASLATLVRRAVETVDPQVPVRTQSFDEILASSVADRRFTTLVLGVFAVTALVLAIVGIYAVVSYSVAQRTREIGVRLALGATPAGVRALVVGTAMRAVVPGMVVGAAIALVDARLLRAMVFGVSPFDPAAIVGALAALFAAALVSSAWPARRATRVNPITALRGE
ncbi:MAG TPA: ABC transporter permease [Gemmatimonadaceae bacterium]|nr:ABC transporter permease [Gemmatimonadaceae bacterium]